MPKTILLPEQLVTDKTNRPKVIVLHGVEYRNHRGDLCSGFYRFNYEGKYYTVLYVYEKHKCIKSQLYYV